MDNNKTAVYENELQKLADLCRRDYPNKFTKENLLSELSKLANINPPLYRVHTDFEKLFPEISISDNQTNCAKCKKFTAITDTVMYKKFNGKSVPMKLTTKYICTEKGLLGKIESASDLQLNKTHLLLPQNASRGLSLGPKNCDKFENRLTGK